MNKINCPSLPFVPVYQCSPFLIYQIIKMIRRTVGNLL